MVWWLSHANRVSTVERSIAKIGCEILEQYCLKWEDTYEKMKTIEP